MNNISPRERFLGAFLHQELDRVPVFDTPNNPELFKRELGQENLYSHGVPMVHLSRKLGMDACLVVERGYTGLISEFVKWSDKYHFTDELGVPYVCNDTSWPLAVPERAAITDRKTWETVTLPDPREKWRHEEIRKAVAEAHRGKKDDIAVIAGVRSGFSVLYISMGLEALSINLFDDPDLIAEMAEELTQFWTESSLAAIEAGADAVFIANDMGLNRGTIISPESIRKYFLPSLTRQIDEIHRAGGKVIFHSCGNIKAVLPDLVEAGIDCYNNIQVGAGMDLKGVKNDFGEKIVLMGNVDATGVMTSNEPMIIENSVRDVIQTASPGGGHILATDHSFHKGIPLKNIYRFIEAGKQFGKYSDL